MARIVGFALVLGGGFASLFLMAEFVRSGPESVDTVGSLTFVMMLTLTGLLFIYLHAVMERLERVEAHLEEERRTEKYLGEARAGQARKEARSAPESPAR